MTTVSEIIPKMRLLRTTVRRRLFTNLRMLILVSMSVFTPPSIHKEFRLRRKESAAFYSI